MNNPEYFSQFSITAPAIVLKPDGALFTSALWLTTVFDCKKDTVNGITTYLLPDSAQYGEDFTYQQTQLIIANGGEVKNWWHWYIVTSMDNLVPTFFRQAFDADNVQRTWRQWVDSIGSFQETNLSDGRFAVPGNAGSDDGTYQAGSVITQITTECDVFNAIQVQALMQ